MSQVWQRVLTMAWRRATVKFACMGSSVILKGFSRVQIVVVYLSEIWMLDWCDRGSFLRYDKWWSVFLLCVLTEVVANKRESVRGLLSKLLLYRVGGCKVRQVNLERNLGTLSWYRVSIVVIDGAIRNTNSGHQVQLTLVHRYLEHNRIAISIPGWQDWAICCRFGNFWEAWATKFRNKIAKFLATFWAISRIFENLLKKLKNFQLLLGDFSENIKIF